MKKALSIFSITVLIFFFVSCGGSKSNDSGPSADNEPAADNDPAAGSDSDSTGTEPSETETICGNSIIETGETCDNDTKECSEINPNFTGGIALCQTDCRGYDLSGCTSGQNPDQDPNPSPDQDPTPAGNIEFERFVADENPNKPAFVTVDDLDNDGYLDMIVAQYGPLLSGNYDIYWGTGKLDQ